MATVLIPTPLRKFTDNSARISVAGQNVAEIIGGLIATYPVIERHLLDANGSIRSFINVFVDEDDIRNLNYENTEVHPHSVISIIPAIAGGAL